MYVQNALPNIVQLTFQKIFDQKTQELLCLKCKLKLNEIVINEEKLGQNKLIKINEDLKKIFDLLKQTEEFKIQAVDYFGSKLKENTEKKPIK